MLNAELLTKSYRRRRVVDGVSLRCEPGTITGLIGPNGAGKTTALRLICGLTRPDHGTALIDGVPFAQLPNAPRTVGVLLDPSGFHEGRTGRATLRRAAQLAGVPRQRVDDYLEHVGLGGRPARSTVGGYSLGMCQRLGLAVALIGEPRLLILDEPANGLDPEGIAWLRHLLRDFADGGGTVLLSSHHLAEVEATVDHVAVIRDGRLVATGALSDLLSAGGTVVRSPDAEELRTALDDAGLLFAARDDGTVLVDAPPEEVARVTRDAGVLVVELRQLERSGLEDVFLALTGPETVA